VKNAVFLIWFVSATLLFGSGLFNGEHRFKALESYTIQDFHFAKPIVYMDVVTFQTLPSDGEIFKLPKKIEYYTDLSVGKLTLDNAYREWAFDYLAKAILKKEYFWKRALPPIFIYAFTTLRFMEAKEKRLKAVTSLQDILDLLGTIDTEAELHLWIEAKFAANEPVAAYSWKKEGSLYRVRFRGLNPFTCFYYEYFLYIDQHGKYIRKKVLKQYRKKGCSVLMI